MGGIWGVVGGDYEAGGQHKRRKGVCLADEGEMPMTYMCDHVQTANVQLYSQVPV